MKKCNKILALMLALGIGGVYTTPVNAWKVFIKDTDSRDKCISYLFIKNQPDDTLSTLVDTLAKKIAVDPKNLSKWLCGTLGEGITDDYSPIMGLTMKFEVVPKGDTFDIRVTRGYLPTGLIAGQPVFGMLFEQRSRPSEGEDAAATRVAGEARVVAYPAAADAAAGTLRGLSRAPGPEPGPGVLATDADRSTMSLAVPASETCASPLADTQNSGRPTGDRGASTLADKKPSSRAVSGPLFRPLPVSAPAGTSLQTCATAHLPRPTEGAAAAATLSGLEGGAAPLVATRPNITFGDPLSQRSARAKPPGVSRPVEDQLAKAMSAKRWNPGVSRENAVLQIYFQNDKTGTSKPLLLDDVLQLPFSVTCLTQKGLMQVICARGNILSNFGCIIIGGSDTRDAIGPLNDRISREVMGFLGNNGVVIVLAKTLPDGPLKYLEAKATERVKLGAFHHLVQTPPTLTSVVETDGNPVVVTGVSIGAEVEKYFLKMSEDKSVAMLATGHTMEGKATLAEAALLTNLVHCCIHAQVRGE